MTEQPMNVTGKLIDIDEEHLTLEPGYISGGCWVPTDEPIIYPHAGLDLKASNWVKRFLGTKVKCRLVGGAIRGISQAWAPKRKEQR